MGHGMLLRILSDLHYILGTRLPYPWDFCRIKLDVTLRLLINSASYIIVYFAFLYWFFSLITKQLWILGERRLKNKDFWLATVLSIVTASQVLWPLMLIFNYFFSCSFYPWITTVMVLYLYTHYSSYWASAFHVIRTSAELLRTSSSEHHTSADRILPVTSTPREIPLIRARSSSESVETGIARILPVNSTAREIPLLRTRSSSESAANGVAGTLPIISLPREVPRSRGRSPSESAESGVARILPITSTPRLISRFRGRTPSELTATGVARTLFFQPSSSELSTISDTCRERRSEDSIYNPMFRRKLGSIGGVQRIEMINDERVGSTEAMPFTEELKEFPSGDLRQSTARSTSIETRSQFFAPKHFFERSPNDMKRKKGFCGRCWKVNKLPFKPGFTSLRDLYTTRSGKVYGPNTYFMGISEYFKHYGLSS